MVIRPLLLLLAVAGCTQTTTSGVPFAAGEPPAGGQQAYFQSHPLRLFEVAAAACDAPGQTVVRPSVDEVRCESLPDPEAAAALILQFDGTVENLPRFVIAFQGLQDSVGYLVTADSYIRVPQRDGGAQQIRFPDARLTQEMTEILTRAGGRVLD